MRKRVSYVSDHNIHHTAIGEYWGPISGFLALRAIERSDASGPLADLVIGRVNDADALLLFSSEAALNEFLDSPPKRHEPCRVMEGDELLRAAHKAGLEIALDLKLDPLDPSGVLYTDVTSTPANFTLSRRHIKMAALFNRVGDYEGVVALHGVSRGGVRKLKAEAQRNHQTVVVQDRIYSITGDQELKSVLVARTKLPKRSKA